MALTVGTDPRVLLDDDSTGAQAAAAVPLVLRPTAAALRRATGRHAAYLVTNTRVLHPAEAASATQEAAEAVLAQAPAARLVLRGDSTLRAHFVEEHDAVCRAQTWAAAPPVLVPALPSAGRITLQGVHYLLVDGAAVPVGETEFARDPHLGYRSSHLLEWAESRSGGRYGAADGVVVGLGAVRGSSGAAEIASAIDAVACQRKPGVVAIDAETDEDICAIVGGIERAWAVGTPFVVRCSPAPAAALAGAVADALVEVPAASRLLVLCGSFVERTTRQLARVATDHPGVSIQIDVSEAVADPVGEGRRLAVRARELLDERSIAVIATPRLHEHEHGGRAVGERLTEALATVACALAPEIDLLVLKGGATSASIVASGLQADLVEVVGPIGHGASLWSVPVRGRELSTIVVPGNTGADDSLAELLGRARSAAAC